MAEGTIGGTKISDLPASSFAYCEPGSGAVSDRCHFPIRDKNGKADPAHVRNALARLATSPFGPKARAKVEAAAKECGIGMQKAAGVEMKAEPMTSSQLDRWLSGKISRRLLVVPFGGPIPKKGAPLGTDLDGEWFDADTDLFGSYKALRASRERLVDWHHEADPTGRMKGAILGHVVLDDAPEDDGVWADFWANAGEQRRALIARLERGGVPLYGSSEAVYKKARDDGHIDEWPLIRHKITTSPQNTFAVVPPLKAILTMDDINLEAIGFAAVKAALVGLGDLSEDITASLPAEAVAASLLAGEDDVKAGRVLSKDREAELRSRVEALMQLIDAWLPTVVADLENDAA